MSKTINLLRLLLICIVILGSFILSYQIIKSDSQTTSKLFSQKNNERLQKQKELEIAQTKQMKYEKCLNTPYQMPALDEELAKIEENYSNKLVSFYFEDFNNNWQLISNEQSVYYGASLIKILDATYLINKAHKKEISLDETITYEPKYHYPYSLGLSTYNYNDEISLQELIHYLLLVSDNSAHEMLYEYIGLDNLKKYAESLGIHLTINELEHYGNLTLTDVKLILKELYNTLNTCEEYSDIILNAMNNDYYNYLNYDDIRIYHKYGELYPYYHDIGIYLDNSPYFIAIMSSLSANKETKKQYQELHQALHEVYQRNIHAKEQYCLNNSNI